MRAIPFTPQKTSDLTAGTLMVRKDDSFTRFRVVIDMKPLVRNGNVLHDEDGHPTGMMSLWPAYLKWSGEEPHRCFHTKGVASINSNFNCYKLQP